ncbi:hypothetical protein vseg_018221 [Gypsophila vaccaria]
MAKPRNTQRQCIVPLASPRILLPQLGPRAGPPTPGSIKSSISKDDLKFRTMSLSAQESEHVSDFPPNLLF